MDPSKTELAMARFSVISPCVNGMLGGKSKSAYYRERAELPVELPGGELRMYSAGTLANWEWKYRHGGFDALVWDTRSDAGTTRVLTAEQMRSVEELRERFPKLGPKGIRKKMIDDGLLAADGASLSTFQRYFRKAGRPGDGDGPGAGKGADGKDRRAFEAEHPNDLWQGDTLFGPYCVIDEATGRRGRSYVQALIDDRTRVITAGVFWPLDNAVNFQLTLRRGIELRGLPLTLYLDNGSPYKNGQLTGICGRLGIVLKHTPVRDGAAKGKIERCFRTLRSRFLAALPDDPDRTVGDLNDLLQDYVAEYNSTPHSALGGATPLQAWDALTESAPPRMPKSAEWLDECFLNRETRRVNKDATVRVRNVLYDVPQHLVGQQVEFAFVPGVDDACWIVDGGGGRTKVEPTDKHANARMPRELPRYRFDYTKGA